MKKKLIHTVLLVACAVMAMVSASAYALGIALQTVRRSWRISLDAIRSESRSTGLMTPRFSGNTVTAPQGTAFTARKFPVAEEAASSAAVQLNDRLSTQHDRQGHTVSLAMAC